MKGPVLEVQSCSFHDEVFSMLFVWLFGCLVFVFVWFGLFVCFETKFLCVALAVLELTL